MNATVALWVGGAALLVAVVAVLYLLLGPQPLPIERRRYKADAPRSGLARAADAATSSVQHLLGEREGPIAEALQLAGLGLRPQEFIVLVGSATVALFAVGLLLAGPLTGVLLAVVAPLGAWMLLRLLTSRRRTAFAAQLDETLQILAGSLRAGYSLPQAAATVATEAAEPTASEFSRVINEARVGRSLVDALEDSARRVKNDDFFWVIQAIAINREVGGNLADVLEGVGHTIRERIHLKRQVKSLAAEGKLSAIILCCLPPFLLLLMSILNPYYLGKFGESPLGMIMLGGSGVMLLVGILWMRSMVNIKF